MRTRTGLCLLICCCAGLAACTAGDPNGPNTTVTTPRVGRPQPPSSAQAALSREAFTPYAALGQSNNDGLAPGQSQFALAEACMTDAGYPNSATSGNLPISIRLGPANLSFAQPWGQWGYLGVAEAELYGFRVPPGSALSDLGIDVPPPTANPPSVSGAEQTALGKCATIVQDFTDAAQNGPLAGIQTLSNDIYSDVLKDAAVKNATQAWSACMAKNGYSFHQPQDVFFQEMRAMYGEKHFVSIGASVSAAANQAQIAAAVTDADCAQSADLPGIYFAVQASYEQQLVNANQQALNAAVREYKASYGKELSKLPALLRTTSATPALPWTPGHAGSGHVGGSSGPSPTHS
jgi:hypothetical protein